jgi:hypothetical protein
VIANDGVYDYGTPHLADVPEGQRAALIAILKAGPSGHIDRLMEQAMEKSPVARWSITHGIWCFGASSPSDYLRMALDYTLAEGIAEKIRCPTLVCDAEEDLFFGGQPQKLYDHLTCEKKLMTFPSEDGAGAHCEVGAARLANARIFDWLDEVLGV